MQWNVPGSNTWGGGIFTYLIYLIYFSYEALIKSINLFLMNGELWQWAWPNFFIRRCSPIVHMGFLWVLQIPSLNHKLEHLSPTSFFIGFIHDWLVEGGLKTFSWGTTKDPRAVLDIDGISSHSQCSRVMLCIHWSRMKFSLKYSQEELWIQMNLQSTRLLYQCFPGRETNQQPLDSKHGCSHRSINVCVSVLQKCVSAWIQLYTRVSQCGSFVTAAQIAGPCLSIPSPDTCTQGPGWMSYPIRPCVPIMSNDPCGELGLKTIFTSFPTIRSERIDGWLHVWGFHYDGGETALMQWWPAEWKWSCTWREMNCKLCRFYSLSLHVSLFSVAHFVSSVFPLSVF